MFIFLRLVAENSLFQVHTGNSFLVFWYVLEKPTAAVGLTYVCSDQWSNNLPSLKNNQIHLLFFLKPDEWSSSRVVLKAQITVSAQNKGTCNTHVGIVALQGILVKDSIRQSAYHCDCVRRSSRGWPELLPVGLLCCWTKIKFKKTFPCTGNTGCCQTPEGLRGWSWSMTLRKIISSCSDSWLWP